MLDKNKENYCSDNIHPEANTGEKTTKFMPFLFYL